MRVYDSEIACGETKRKYIRFHYGGYDQQARLQAFKDMTAERKRRSMDVEVITPFKHKRDTIEYWLQFERSAMLRHGLYNQ